MPTLFHLIIIQLREKRQFIYFSEALSLTAKVSLLKHKQTMVMTYQREGIESVPFIGYIDALSVIVLVFVVITAFTAIMFTQNKHAMIQAQQEVRKLQAQLQQIEERLHTAGYQYLQEIPHRLEWRDAALTKQILENTGWTEHVAELPMYEDWKQLTRYSPEILRNFTETETYLAEMQRTLTRHAEVLVKAGYADIAEIPPKEEWELSQDRLTSYQNLLEDVGFHGNIDTLYSFLEQWNKIILEMKRVFKVETNEPESMLRKLRSLESLKKKVVIPVAQGSIYFGSGQVQIQDEFKRKLDQHIEEARAAIKNGAYDLIQIEGHTDTVPVRSDNPLYKDNWELSAARAHAVAQYFIERGIPPQHLAVVGHSEYKPKMPGEHADALAQNRRIEIVFLNSSLLNLGLDE